MAAMVWSTTLAAAHSYQPRPNRAIRRRCVKLGLHLGGSPSYARTVGFASQKFARTRAVPEAAPEVEVDGTARTDDEIPEAVGTAGKEELMLWLTA